MWIIERQLIHLGLSSEISYSEILLFISRYYSFHSVVTLYHHYTTPYVHYQYIIKIGSLSCWLDLNTMNSQVQRVNFQFHNCQIKGTTSSDLLSNARAKNVEALEKSRGGNYHRLLEDWYTIAGSDVNSASLGEFDCVFEFASPERALIFKISRTSGRSSIVANAKISSCWNPVSINRYN